jgi:hypothetical protein
MNALKYFLLALFMSLSFCKLSAQNKNYECITCKSDTLFKDVKLYGGLIHQHQDFFNKAFSFQGIELGAVINQSLLLGIYGSTFASNLEVKVANSPFYAFITQSGLLVGVVKNEEKVLHTGWLLNIGYFSLTGDNSNFNITKVNQPMVKLSGMVLSPQIYGELNTTKWMKLRAGLAYSFYSYEDHSFIKTSDLQNISFTFGFIFGKFN